MSKFTKTLYFILLIFCLGIIVYMFLAGPSFWMNNVSVYCNNIPVMDTLDCAFLIKTVIIILIWKWLFSLYEFIWEPDKKESL